MYVVRDLGVGAALIDRALVLNSNLAEAWHWGGWVKTFLGEPETAIERFARGCGNSIPRYVFQISKMYSPPFRRAEDLSRLEEGLRQAGLPE